MDDTNSVQHDVRRILPFAVMLFLLGPRGTAWLVRGVGLLLLMFLTTHHRRDAFGVDTGGFVMTPLSWVLLVVFVLHLVIGLYMLGKPPRQYRPLP